MTSSEENYVYPNDRKQIKNMIPISKKMSGHEERIKKKPKRKEKKKKEAKEKKREDKIK